MAAPLTGCSPAPQHGTHHASPTAPPIALFPTTLYHQDEQGASEQNEWCQAVPNHLYCCSEAPQSLGRQSPS